MQTIGLNSNSTIFANISMTCVQEIIDRHINCLKNTSKRGNIKESNKMIAKCVQNGFRKEALKIFELMEHS